jgi:DNA-binding NarL/FixJ family response regulator
MKNLMTCPSKPLPDIKDNTKLILIVADQRMLRDAYKFMLAPETDFRVIGEAQDGVDAICLVKSTKPDLVMLDISMPRVDGFSVLRAIKNIDQSIKALIISMHGSDQFVMEALQAGADGCVLKDTSRSEMLLAMRSTLAGKIYINPKIAKTLGGEYNRRGRTTEKSAGEMVTNREKEIIKLIAESYQNKKIAQILNISVKTVETHRHNIMKKLNLHSGSDITRFAYANGIVISKPRV